jgi:hypothetical protein
LRTFKPDSRDKVQSDLSRIDSSAEGMVHALLTCSRIGARSFQISRWCPDFRLASSCPTLLYSSPSSFGVYLLTPRLKSINAIKYGGTSTGSSYPRRLWTRIRCYSTGSSSSNFLRACSKTQEKATWSTTPHHIIGGVFSDFHSFFNMIGTCDKQGGAARRRPGVPMFVTLVTGSYLGLKWWWCPKLTVAVSAL